MDSLGTTAYWGENNVTFTRRAAIAVAAGLSFIVSPALAGGTIESATGHGTLDDGARQFSFNAKRHADGTVSGQAQLVNTLFAGTEDSPAPYRLHLDITCMKRYGNIVVLGGTTKSTNDPNLVDAAFFSVQDNGEPGSTGEPVDEISRVYFWDTDPQTTGDPQACEMTLADDFPREPIESGNIQVRPYEG